MVRLGPRCPLARCCSVPFACSPLVFSSADQKKEVEKVLIRQCLKTASKTLTEGSNEREHDEASPSSIVLYPFVCLGSFFLACFLTFVLSLEYLSLSCQPF